MTDSIGCDSSRHTGRAVRALHLGERLDLRAITGFDVLSATPLTLSVGREGRAVLFRYGTAVLSGLTPAEEATFVEAVAPALSAPVVPPEAETLSVHVDATAAEGMDAKGTLTVRNLELARFQIVSEVLAKSAALAHQESEVARVFPMIEPLADRLRREGHRITGQRELLSRLADVLQAQMRLVGRLAVTEKPDLTWDDPDLDRLWVRLAIEFELAERGQALTRKTDLMSDSLGLLIGLAQQRQSIRVEWYIVILIVIEIVLLVFDLFFASHV